MKGYENMALRPCDIARRLNISTTALRMYEKWGMIPPVQRTPNGYRLYTAVHAAYFACIRKMLPGFTLTRIAKILQEVMAKRIDAALWMAVHSVAGLHREKSAAEKAVCDIITDGGSEKRYTVHEASIKTGVPATTIRYWDKEGIISASRADGNNYRMYTEEHIRQIRTSAALKISLCSGRNRHSNAREEACISNDNGADGITAKSEGIVQYLDKMNRQTIRGLCALYHLCTQVEADCYDKFLV